MPDAAPRSYAWILAATVALGLGVVAAINAAVDPFAMLDAPRIPGLNAEKTQAHMMGVRTEKSVRLGLGDFDAAIFGSSRAAIGLDPADPAFEGRPVFNAALHATSAEELLHVFRYAVERQDLELAVVGLDFLMWNGARVPGKEFHASAFAGGAPAWLALQRLVSWDVLEASWATVEANGAGRRAEYQPDGSLTGVPVPANGWNTREAFDRVLAMFATNQETYGCFRYAPERVAMIGELLRAADERGTRVLLFLSPIHVEQLQLIAALELLPAFERWKRDLTREVAAVQSGGGPQVVLWDFSAAEAANVEEVPADGSPMTWYWEASHYRRALGSRVLHHMLEPEADDGPRIAPGVALTPETLDGQIDHQRRARAAWADAHLEERASIQRLVSRTAAIRRRICRAMRAQQLQPDRRGGAGPIPGAARPAR
ncbi:MAG: hypothetical protein ACQGVK_00080 [Myxococcota bacterium]